MNESRLHEVQRFPSLFIWQKKFTKAKSAASEKSFHSWKKSWQIKNLKILKKKDQKRFSKTKSTSPPRHRHHHHHSEWKIKITQQWNKTEFFLKYTFCSFILLNEHICFLCWFFHVLLFSHFYRKEYKKLKLVNGEETTAVERAHHHMWKKK